MIHLHIFRNSPSACSSDWEPNDGRMPDLKGSSAAVPLILLQPLREGVEHFSELVTPAPPCHFCRENISRPVHEDCTRLKIVSRGKKLKGTDFCTA